MNIIRTTDIIEKNYNSSVSYDVLEKKHYLLEAQLLRNDKKITKNLQILNHKFELCIYIIRV